jgi:hypothetical protein
VKRANSPAFLESIANDPRVRPFIGAGLGEFRAGDSWERSIGLEFERGGVVFLKEAPGIYSAHLVFLPHASPLKKCLQSLRYVFTRTDCHTVTGSIPVDNRQARRIARLAGMDYLGDREGYSHYRLTARDWIRQRKA